jgi:glycosyltransferase involved in cell wall biosynthesis
MSTLKFIAGQGFLKLKKRSGLLADSILAGLGFSIIRRPSKSAVLKNVFDTSLPQNALLSYISSVFSENDQSNRHTNRYTTYIIGEVLRDCGYNVDVINYDAEFPGDFSKYHLVIGLGKSLEQVLLQRPESIGTKVIWFGTGCNPLFSNQATLQRLRDFYVRTGKVIPASSRYIREDWPLQHEIADWIILHGASFARSTYRQENISSVHAPVFIHHNWQKTIAEWNDASLNYLWFGNGGAIHKGLDLVIETFVNLPHLKLHIAGDIEHESGFFNHYRHLFNPQSNIIYHGFVKVDSPEFSQLMNRCAFVIYPSASEGNSPSVLTCMANGGLIPIVSRNADIDLDGYGIYIEHITLNGVMEAALMAARLSPEQLFAQSELILNKIPPIHSFGHFREEFRDAFLNAIQSLRR